MEKLLQNDENFRVELIDWHGQHAVRKNLQPSTNERRQKTFQNEITGTELFSEIVYAHPDWHVKVPRTFEKGEGWVIREYLEGETLCTEESRLEQAAPGVKRLATALAFIDRVEPDLNIAPPFEDSAPYTNIRKRFETWSKGPLESSILAHEAYESAQQLIATFQPYLVPRYAHGDVSPLKHVLVDATGTIGLFDFEHFSSQKPRYYDVAYCYSRLFTRVGDKRIAGSFLNSFLEVAETPPHQTEQLLAIMTQRAIGMHFDAFNDRAKGVDYVDRAQELLALCLQGDVMRLCTVQ